jgi:two-component system NtrC family sensor kinase
MRPENNGGQDILSLAIPLNPIASSVPLEDVAELFLNPDYANVLSLPVVDEGRPVGVISRYRFMDIYLKPYGRELHGKRPISSFMVNSPLVVAHDQPLAEAAHHVTQNMRFPLMEDFIITKQGQYAGIGFVVDLLKAMELQLRANSDELHEAYSRLKSSQLALVQSEKMASLGQMVAGIAHEINTPLGYVQNNVAMGQELFAQVQAMNDSYETLVDSLMDEGASAEHVSAQMQHVAELRNGTNAGEMLEAMQGLMADSLYGIEQISELVLNLKNFSRMDAAATEAVSLNDCIESALNIGRNVLKGKVEVVKELGDLPKITCSPSQLNQVFLNLFTNAAQAMETNGSLTIRTWHEDGAVRASVRDNGKGILPENLARIFDPFFTTKPVGQGTGLGLAITHQIIQQHGGEITVESEVGKGTCFYVRLPAANAAQRHEESSLSSALAMLRVA